jgi:hypothetical protein
MKNTALNDWRLGGFVALSRRRLIREIAMIWLIWMDPTAIMAN